VLVLTTQTIEAIRLDVLLLPTIEALVLITLLTTIIEAVLERIRVGRTRQILITEATRLDHPLPITEVTDLALRLQEAEVIPQEGQVVAVVLEVTEDDNPSTKFSTYEKDFIHCP